MNLKMRLHFVAPLLLCIYDVICLPNLKGNTDNAANIADSGVKVSNTSASPPYSVLWKFNGSIEDTRAIQSKMMQSFMNLSVDPCEDFYEYACGNWQHLHPISKDQSEKTMFAFLENNIESELRDLLSQPVPSNPENQELSTEEKARAYFVTCIDDEAINRRGIDPLLHFIDELGGWPAVDENWSEKEFDWLQLAIKTSLLKYPSILFADVAIDWRNSSKYSIYLQESRLDSHFQNEFVDFDNDQHLDAYRNLIVTVLKLVSVNPDKAKNTANEIIDFESQLDNIRPPWGMTLSEYYIATTIEGLSKNYSNIDWLTYLSAVLETSLQPNQSVVMISAYYYENLTYILDEVKPRTLANYMVWRSVYRFLHTLDDDFRVVLQTFIEAKTGQKETAPRWKECLQELNSKMGMATGAMLVRRYFDDINRTELVDLLSDIKSSFRETLLQIDWMDEKTKELARNKIDQIKLAAGYPDFILNAKELNKLYSDFQVAPGKRFENSVNLEKYSFRVRRKRFRDPVDKELWSIMPAVVNAIYYKPANRIDVPVGFLQPPLFHKHFPRALNYGAIGFFIGHEVTHSFDATYDAAGNVIEWWSPETLKAFKKKEQCFIEQYSNFSVDGIFLNGSKTTAEDIADSGGVRHAFQVYREWQNVNMNGNQLSFETMPDLNLTSDQLFFLSYAQLFCNALRPEFIKNSIQNGTHSLDKFRVIGALANFEEFSEVFQCPSGAKMNPQKKCRLW